MRARASGSRRLKPRSSWSRSSIDDVVVVDRRRVDGSEFDVDAMAPEPARLIDAGAVEQPVEPGVEAIGAAQCGQVTPGSDERLLDGVLGLVGIAQDEPGGGVQPEDRGACQRGEGVMIAPSRSLHEFLLHHAPRRWRGRRGRAHRVWRGEPPVRSEIVPRRGADAVPSRSPDPDLAAAELPRLVKIQEADAKSLLVAQGLPVPGWEVAHTVPEARAAAERILAAAPSAVVIKAQVLVGGRGKAGGVKLASSARRGRDGRRGRSSAWTSRASRSARSWSAPAADIASEFYMSAVLDRAARRILLMGSAEGGVEIEQVAVDHPEAIVRRHADPLLGLLDYQAREFAFAMGLGGHLKAAVAIAKGLVRTMLAYDADLVEINPLAIVRETGADGAAVERLVCLDAKVTLDDSALPRHPGARGPARPRRGGPGRPRGARGRPDLHQARRHDRLHGQRRRAWR